MLCRIRGCFRHPEVRALHGSITDEKSLFWLLLVTVHNCWTITLGLANYGNARSSKSTGELIRRNETQIKCEANVNKPRGGVACWGKPGVGKSLWGEHAPWLLQTQERAGYAWFERAVLGKSARIFTSRKIVAQLGLEAMTQWWYQILKTDDLAFFLVVLC